MRRSKIEYSTDAAGLVEARVQLDMLGVRGTGVTRRGAQENLRWRLRGYALLVEQALARLETDMENDEDGDLAVIDRV